MKIVVLYQYYQSEKAPGHSLIYDWTQYLANSGHDVTVVAGETGYMACHRPTLPWFRRIKRIEQIGLVTVIRTYTFHASHRNYFHRLLNFLSFSLSSSFALAIIKKPHVVIASSPPIFSAFSAWFVSKCRRLPFVIEVRDLWPASIIQMGMLKNKWLISILSWMEKTLYNHSDRIIALTTGIKHNICERGWPNEKISLIHCGVNVNQLYPDNTAKEIRQRYQLQNKKIILYFGALGEANNIDVILRAAKHLENHNDFFFMLVGDGMRSDSIKNEIQKRNLLNIGVYPAVPKNQARLYINAADICIVTLLDIPLFKGALPTKLLDYMACGVPILCGVEGEAQDLLNKSQAGLTFSPNDDTALANLILNLVNDPLSRKKMGENGVQFIHSHFSALKMNKQIEEIVLQYE